MSANHTNGVNGTSSEPTLHWTIGLLNGQCKYLTAETFGCKVNANGTALKKKQLWTLEPYGEEDAVCLRSHLGRYLAVDQFGNVACEAEEKDPACKFSIAVVDDLTGAWALRNQVRGYYLGASQDKLTCSAKSPCGPAERWTVHLAARPQVNLRSVGRRRYARLSSAQDEIQVDANTPWGEDTLFTLEFRESGKYAIRTANDRYLQSEGKLSASCETDCLFTLEFHSGYLALRDKHGRYVSPIGSKAVLRTRSQSVTKDELFSLEESTPQVAFVGVNGKYVSVKQEEVDRVILENDFCEPHISENYISPLVLVREAAGLTKLSNWKCPEIIGPRRVIILNKPRAAEEEITEEHEGPRRPRSLSIGGRSRPPRPPLPRRRSRRTLRSIQDRPN
ncbi:FSCN1 [Cordylochernes scorpioides]|uniref:FSCN1 n=1 Tax=Cordylochernes scorpioides TaxID=51811 RepID=A0ABY6JXP4_9ARAC|nr:FSCN1 [Cordylochernes scorpioides]